MILCGLHQTSFVLAHRPNMGKRAEEPEVKLSAKEKRQQKAREKAGAVAKKKKDVEVDEVAEVRP